MAETDETKGSSAQRPRIGGRADSKHSKKMRKLSDFCFAPRYIKFFTAFFKDEDGEPLDPYEEIEGHITRWINVSQNEKRGVEILQTQLEATKDEVIVTVLYRLFELYT